MKTLFAIPLFTSIAFVGCDRITQINPPPAAPAPQTVQPIVVQPPVQIQVQPRPQPRPQPQPRININIDANQHPHHHHHHDH
jgi:hypothetical protein